MAPATSSDPSPTMTCVRVARVLVPLLKSPLLSRQGTRLRSLTWQWQIRGKLRVNIQLWAGRWGAPRRTVGATSLRRAASQSSLARRPWPTTKTTDPSG